MQENEKKAIQKRKKLNLKVKQDFQIWLLIRIMGTAIITIVVVSIILYFYSATAVDSDYLSHSLEVRKISDVLLPVILAASLTSICAGLLLALFLPQKIAGPIYRIEQDLMQIKNGDLTKTINLRQADILKDFAKTINMTVDNFRNMIHEIKGNNRDLEAKITAGEIPEIKEAFEKQKNSLEKFIT